VLCCLRVWMAAAWLRVICSVLAAAVSNASSCAPWVSFGKAAGVLQVLRQRYDHPCSFVFGGKRSREVTGSFSQVSPDVPPTPRDPFVVCHVPPPAVW
jgi:hypothetical protein